MAKTIRLGFYPEKNQPVVKEPKVAESAVIASPAIHSGLLLPWFMNVRPHRDIEQGNLDESVFAASLGEVARGKGRDVYLDPEKFFQKTFFTSGMKNVVRQVIKGLNGNEEAENRVISLQTGFGGGKTHSLISLYHLVKMGKSAVDSELTQDMIRETGTPVYDKVNIAVFTNESNDPTQGRFAGDTHIKTIWGDLAWQLGGSKAYEIVRPNDENQTAPLGLFKKVLEQVSPAMILIDELAHYCVTASTIRVGASTLADQTISFIQELTEAISAFGAGVCCCHFTRKSP
jgi:predicted AAA+ superfamily ATPase